MRIKRKIVKIDEGKCTGCGQCVPACVEGAIAIVGGKAKLLRDSYCDGLGACLGECPEGAITIEEREAEPFDESALHQKHAEPSVQAPCPGVAARVIEREPASRTAPESRVAPIGSELRQWPVQIALVPPDAPYFRNANLLLVADCVPFALGDFHVRFLRGHSVAVGCPKLDDFEFYIEKVTSILERSPIASLTVIHMSVPCCRGLVHIARKALAASGKSIPARAITVSLKGEVIAEEPLETGK